MTSRSAGGWRSAQIRLSDLRLRLEAKTHYGKSVLFLPQTCNTKLCLTPCAVLVKWDLNRGWKAAPTDINFVGVEEFWSVGKLDL